MFFFSNVWLDIGWVVWFYKTNKVKMNLISHKFKRKHVLSFSLLFEIF